MLSFITSAPRAAFEFATSLLPTSYVGIAAVVLSVAYLSLGKKLEEKVPSPFLGVTPRIHVLLLNSPFKD